MPTKRLSMRHLREVLRLRLHVQLSLRQIKNSLHLSLGAIQKITCKAKQLELTWEKIEPLDNKQLSSLFNPKEETASITPEKHLPDWTEVRFELSKKGVTVYLLWDDCMDAGGRATQEQLPKNISSNTPHEAIAIHSSAYCIEPGLANRNVPMRQVHKVGEKLFVDYAGQTMPIINPDTGEIRKAQIFVAVLGASNYTYVEATWSQTLQDWLSSHVNTFEYLGGVPEIVIPDNLKSGVTKACRYDLDINRAYQQQAHHYQIAIIPARPLKPKDKAKAEVGVQIIERWILARLRHHQFFTLAELNAQIKTLLEEVNHR